VPELPDPVAYAVPGFILLLIVEMIVSRRQDRSRYEARDTLTSLLLGTGSQVAGALVGAAVIGMAVWVHQFRLFDIGIAFGHGGGRGFSVFSLTTLPIMPSTAARTGSAGSGRAMSSTTARSIIICRPRCGRRGRVFSASPSSFASRCF
jgi:hypothetical protein